MSIQSFAARELDRAGFSPSEKAAFLKILKVFFDEFDSGGAVHFSVPILRRLLNGQPLTPITGEADEWMYVGDMGDDPVWQNVRCSSVFKGKDGRAYDINVAGRPTITFPYDPVTQDPPSPVVEL